LEVAQRQTKAAGTQMLMIGMNHVRPGVTNVVPAGTRSSARTM